jgi:hypothetical protein
VRENRYYSEDWTFCENWRDMGGKIWVDKRVLLKHTGTYVFDFAAQEPLYKALHEAAQIQQAQQAQTAAAVPAESPAPVVAKVLASSDKKPAVKAKEKKSVKPAKVA